MTSEASLLRWLIFASAALVANGCASSSTDAASSTSALETKAPSFVKLPGEVTLITCAPELGFEVEASAPLPSSAVTASLGALDCLVETPEKLLCYWGKNASDPDSGTVTLTVKDATGASASRDVRYSFIDFDCPGGP